MAISYVVGSNGNITVEELSSDVKPDGQPGWSLLLTDTGATFYWDASTAAWVAAGGGGGGGITELTGDVTAGPGTGSQVATIANKAYIVSLALLGSPLANSQATYILFEHAVTFPANFGAVPAGQSSGATGTANATASTAFSIDKRTANPNTFGTNVGTITIGAGGITATLATAGGASYTTAPGELWRIIGPSSADATFANLTATLVGTR